MTIDGQIARLDRSVEELAAAVASLDEKLFLERLNGWSSRDIVAHLVGWNRLIIEGSRQIMRGELPSYDVDPGENYSKVNAKLIPRVPLDGPARAARRAPDLGPGAGAIPKDTGHRHLAAGFWCEAPGLDRHHS